MGFEATIVADSVSPEGKRLTTMVVSFPRIILAEFNTHRVLSRNSASSRAIPVAKILDRVKQDPFIPVSWGKNQKGMSADEEIPENLQDYARVHWLDARDSMIRKAQCLMDLGVHKQIANRLLEPWMFTTVLVSSTTYHNFFRLRNHPKAQPEMQRIAGIMQSVYEGSVPKSLKEGEWHLPFLREEDLNLPLEEIRNVVTARCARLSYLTHDGRRDHAEDLRLHALLASDGHWSPFEHVATPCPGRHGNFEGWKQYRQLVDTHPY